MTRKPFVIIIVIALLTGGIWWMSKYQKSDSTKDHSEINFSYKNTEKVQRIFFTNKSKKFIDLRKKNDDTWTVNDKRVAWQKKVDFLLETFEKVRVKGTAPIPARDNIIKHMAITGIKVEIYSDNEEPDLVYYIGGTTPDQMGTYFWMEGAETPYVTYIPGFTGYLNSRFDLQERNWYSPTLFEYKPENINAIGISLKGQSYTIQRREGNLVMLNQNGETYPANPNALSSYLNHFRKLNMEATIDLVEEKRDSILNTEPFAVVSVEDINNTTKTLLIFQKPAYDKMHNLHTDDGERLTYDPNRYFACWKGSKDFMIIQDYTFAKVLKKPEEFID